MTVLPGSARYYRLRSRVIPLASRNLFHESSCLPEKSGGLSAPLGRSSILRAMNLLSVMLMILFPLSPALRLLEFVRWFIGVVAHGLEDPAYVEELKEGGEELIKLDHWLCDMECFLHIVIG